ncbi:MAG: ABC transporter permease [Firmicutes bacterium]|nr:ABC transporter permease [Bacillota bacterium]
MKSLLKSDNWYLKCGAFIITIILLTVITGLFWTPYDPNYMDASVRLSSPSLAHIFGTDNFGRDIFSRVMQGLGTSFMVSFCINLIGLVFGTAIGAAAGYSGGLFDDILMRICDAITAFPSVMLALVVIAVIGTGDMNIIWILGILFIPSYARMVRSEFVQQKSCNYVRMAKLMGAKPLRVIFVHILPNIYKTLLPAATIGFNNAVLAEASMSFLGIGVSANKPSLGRMLNESQGFLIGGAPWYAAFVGLAIVLLVMGLALLGEGLQREQNRGKK